MLNQVVLVGRLTRNIKINKGESGKKIATISLAIPRSFKNMDGTYDTDFVDCVAFENVASNTAQYCGKGDIVGIKGRIQSRVIENEDKKRYWIKSSDSSFFCENLCGHYGKSCKGK